MKDSVQNVDEFESIGIAENKGGSTGGATALPL